MGLRKLQQPLRGWTLWQGGARQHLRLGAGKSLDQGAGMTLRVVVSFWGLLRRGDKAAVPSLNAANTFWGAASWINVVEAERMARHFCSTSFGDRLFACHVTLLLLPPTSDEAQLGVWRALADDRYRLSCNLPGQKSPTS